MYKTELIKSQNPTSIKNKVQAWLDEQFLSNSGFKVISVSYTYEPEKGYRAFITYKE